MADTDSIWAELKAGALPPRDLPLAPATAALPMAATGGKPIIRLRARDAATATPSTTASHPPATAAAAAAATASNSVAPPRTADELVESMQREINALSDERVDTRRRALQCLVDTLVVSGGSALSDSAGGKARLSPPSTAIATALAAVLKAALKRFSDPVEACREMAIRLVLEHVLVSSTPVTALPYLLPVLVFRVVHAPNESVRTEPSEELRLLLARLTRVACQLVPACEWVRFLGDLVPVLISQLSDPFHSVKQEVCVALRLLSSAPELVEPLKGSSIHLLAALIPQLVSRHSRVRVLAIEALQPLMYARGAEMIRELTGFREANVVPIAAFYKGDQRINYFGKLTTDDSPLVRTAFYRMLAAWWEDLPERYDYETLLFPYLLSGLWDHSLDVQQQVLDALDRIGAEHEKDHFVRLREELLYAQRAEAKLPQFSRHLPSVLPAPFAARPRLGTRLVLRTQLSRLLTAIITELGDWHLHLKRHALCLLRTLLIASEEHATEHVLRLVPVLARLLHAILQREAEQDDRFHSGTNAIAHIVAGGGTSASAALTLNSHIGKTNSAVISAHTIDQDPFHQNEDLKTPTLDCLALLARFVHTDVLMPLLLPSMRSFEQCEFFWKVTAQPEEQAVGLPPTPTAATTSEPRKQALIAEAVHALGTLSTNCRLCVLLQVLRFAPPEWILPYADSILELFFIEEYATFSDTQQVQLTVEIVNRLVQCTGRAWLAGDHVPLHTYSSSFARSNEQVAAAAGDTDATLDSADDHTMHPILATCRSRVCLLFVLHMRCLAVVRYKATWNVQKPAAASPTANGGTQCVLSEYLLVSLSPRLRTGFEFVQSMDASAAAALTQQLNASLAALAQYNGSSGTSEAPAHEALHSSWLPVWMRALVLMRRSLQLRLNFRNTDVVSVWYALLSVATMRHASASIEADVCTLIEHAAEADVRSTAYAFRVAQAVLVTCQDGASLPIATRRRLLECLLDAAVMPALERRASRLTEQVSESTAAVVVAGDDDWIGVLAETARLSLGACLSACVDSQRRGRLIAALIAVLQHEPRATVRTQLIELIAAFARTAEADAETAALVVAALRRRQDDADEAVSRAAAAAIEVWIGV